MDKSLAMLAANWLEECTRKHDLCRPVDPAFRPTRLIQILGADKVKLILPAEEHSGPYVAFSHCWGGVEALKLRRHDLSRFRTGLGINELPASYQEAISICPSMNLYFIWIDSLCIIQDSDEDWEREAVNMKLVYGNASLNLCAATGSNCLEKSFTSREPFLFKPLELVSSWSNQEPQNFLLTFTDMFQEDVSESPLHARAWVYQEYYLSKRSLILGRGQMWWHCSEVLACEGHPNGMSDGLGTWQSGASSLKHNSDQEPLRNSGHISPYCSASGWVHRVKQYARTCLTKETDRAIAFSGVAQAFGESHNITEKYLAGLWRCHLLRDICWGVRFRCITRRRVGYRAPSWSWISLDGPFDLCPDIEQGPSVAFLERVWAHYGHQEKGIIALSKGGGLEVCGHLMGPRRVGAKGEPSYFEISADQPCGNIPDSREPWHKVLWDEHDSAEEPMVSYLDKLNLRCRGKPLVDGGCRETLRLKDAEGSFFYLPIHESGLVLYGLVLYQPTHQSGIFHRVGKWESNACLDKSDISSLRVVYPRQIVYII
ncbi:hypothetical protein FALBO_3328 [Fusarium albosuccineum]|uniref:Heterokaryon incompatibility domain-containing protein n=1 Tax=Fusarium albosuccineum TaxID=1237068 RepID=A0A8H4LKZ2_9HYPO|nr:hypothetical protein FALBO_3328 [Fusarium albosuccineum]